MRIVFDKGTPRPLRRRLFGHDVETSVAGFRGRARGSAGGWRPGPLFFAGRGPPALGVGRAVIRAWHFKAGAVNVFSGLRAPAAPSLTVNTAFVGPERCHLFPRRRGLLSRSWRRTSCRAIPASCGVGVPWGCCLCSLMGHPRAMRGPRPLHRPGLCPTRGRSPHLRGVQPAFVGAEGCHRGIPASAGGRAARHVK